MKIQQRDKEILCRCYEQQFLLHEHVAQYYFPEVQVQKARLRILELQQAGLIRKESWPILGNRKIIRLTQAGIVYARQFHPVDIPQVRRINVDAIEHDSIVTSIALRLHQLWDGVWVPERALKKEDYAQIPDGIFVFDSGNKVAIEVENSPKSRTRYLKLFDRWRAVQMRLILYIATSPRISAYLKRYLMDAPKGIPFALVEWAHLSSGTPTAWCPKGDLEIFTRRSF